VPGGAGTHLEARVPDGYLYSNDHGPLEPVDGPGTDWMWELALHYERMRRAYPDQQLCIVFDIDGTILDLPHLVVHALLGYDREHGSEYFRGLRVPKTSASMRTGSTSSSEAWRSPPLSAPPLWPGTTSICGAPRGSWRRTSPTGEFSV
jgi:hypothetical protein